MKFAAILKDRFKGMTFALTRFPVTFIMLFIIAVLNAAAIENNKDYIKFILSLAIGAVSCLTAQTIYERFFKKPPARIISALAGILISLVYYAAVYKAAQIGVVIGIRTAVAAFILIIAFILVPSIKSDHNFNEVFLIVFKSIFTAAFFSAVIWGGLSLILLAVDRLLISVGSNAYAHTANIVWILIAPLFFLSYIPVLNGEERDEEKAQKASSYPRFLEILISYVLIPLTAVYTVVLILYIVKTALTGNLGRNLLEPLILSYSVAVILLYLLSSGLKNRFSSLFRLVLPKVLIPIVLFQLYSSISVTVSEGFIPSRYFVILFGIYSVLFGVLTCLLPLKKNGVIAAAVIIFAAISILPPVDAFTVSRLSQTSVLRNTLIRNGMLQGNRITPKTDLGEKDKTAITKSVENLYRLGYLSGLSFIPSGFDLNQSFASTFGFEQRISSEISAKYLELDPSSVISTGGYEFMYLGYINNVSPENTLCSFSKNGKSYHLDFIPENGGRLIIKDEKNTNLLASDLMPLLSGVTDTQTSPKSQVSPDKLTYSTQNNLAGLRMVFRNLNITNKSGNIEYNAEIIIYMTIK